MQKTGYLLLAHENMTTSLHSFHEDVAKQFLDLIQALDVPQIPTYVSREIEESKIKYLAVVIGVPSEITRSNLDKLIALLPEELRGAFRYIPG